MSVTISTIFAIKFNAKQINMKYIYSVALWIVWNVPCGRLAPKLMAFGVGSKGWKKL
jgi:hypothetical protein